MTEMGPDETFYEEDSSLEEVLAAYERGIKGVTAAPAADMRWEDADPGAVARVLVRVEWKGGKIREYEAREPQDFSMNDPETAMLIQPMGMAVQAAGSPVVPVMAATPSLRLLFRANPRHSMVIRTERTAAPAEKPVHVQAAVIRDGEPAELPRPYAPRSTPAEFADCALVSDDCGEQWKYSEPGDVWNLIDGHSVVPHSARSWQRLQAESGPLTVYGDR